MNTENTADNPVRVKVGEWSLESDSNGWRFGKPRAVELDGKRTYVLTDVRYYSGIEGALRGIERLARAGLVKVTARESATIFELRQYLAECNRVVLEVAERLETQLRRRVIAEELDEAGTMSAIEAHP